MTNMDENKYAVLLTDTQEVKILECDPQEELFKIARGAIGCDWIELVEPEPLARDGFLLLIDEEGKLRNDELGINCIASLLYGADQHGDPIVGDAIVVKSAGECLELLTSDEAQHLAEGFTKDRAKAIEKISRAFNLQPIPKQDLPDRHRRQPCRKDGMER